MPDDALWIEDGYTRSHRVEAVPGLHPAVEVSFRPAVERERKRYDAALATRDAEKVEAFEADLIARHVLAINGARRRRGRTGSTACTRRSGRRC